MVFKTVANKLHPPEEALSQDIKCYLDVGASFIYGIMRLLEAILVSKNIDLVLIEYHRDKNLGIAGANSSSLKTINKISQESYNSHAYVAKISYLVYATTLLDTFINDTTLFLFLLNPSSLGTNQQISIDAVLKSNNIDEIVTQAAVKKSRDISYETYCKRIKFLQDRFGVSKKIGQKLLRSLAKFTELRHQIAHDQSLYRLKLNNNLCIVSEQKACLKRPTKISEDDIWDAIDTYRAIAHSIMHDVFCHILKASERQEVKDILSVTQGEKLAKQLQPMSNNQITQK